MTGVRVASAAERQRRRRQLKREGCLPVTIDVSRQTRDALVDAGLLAAWDDDNKVAVRAAVQRLVDDLQHVTL